MGREKKFEACVKNTKGVFVFVEILVISLSLCEAKFTCHHAKCDVAVSKHYFQKVPGSAEIMIKTFLHRIVTTSWNETGFILPLRFPE